MNQPMHCQRYPVAFQEPECCRFGQLPGFFAGPILAGRHLGPDREFFGKGKRLFLQLVSLMKSGQGFGYPGQGGQGQGSYRFG